MSIPDNRVLAEPISMKTQNLFQIFGTLRRKCRTAPLSLVTTRRTDWYGGLEARQANRLTE
jgi:hypothetical protein